MEMDLPLWRRDCIMDCCDRRVLVADGLGDGDRSRKGIFGGIAEGLGDYAIVHWMDDPCPTVCCPRTCSRLFSWSWTARAGAGMPCGLPSSCWPPRCEYAIVPWMDVSTRVDVGTPLLGQGLGHGPLQQGVSRAALLPPGGRPVGSKAVFHLAAFPRPTLCGRRRTPPGSAPTRRLQSRSAPRQAAVQSAPRPLMRPRSFPRPLPLLWNHVGSWPPLRQ